MNVDNDFEEILGSLDVFYVNVMLILEYYFYFYWGSKVIILLENLKCHLGICYHFMFWEVFFLFSQFEATLDCCLQYETLN